MHHRFQMKTTLTISWGFPHHVHHGTACDGKEDNARGCTSSYRAAFMTSFVLWAGRREELCFHSFAFVGDSLPLQLNWHHFKAQPQIDQKCSNSLVLEPITAASILAGNTVIGPKSGHDDPVSPGHQHVRKPGR